MMGEFFSRTARSGKQHFPERAVLENRIFQNGPFYKIIFSRTARSIKSSFPERPVLEILLL